MGDLLFVLVVLAEWMDINAEEALRRANDKFIRRFTAMEQAIVAGGSKLRGMNVDEMDQVWNQVKRDEQQHTQA
jgi:ATP diphosphatase